MLEFQAALVAVAAAISQADNPVRLVVLEHLGKATLAALAQTQTQHQTAAVAAVAHRQSAVMVVVTLVVQVALGLPTQLLAHQ